MISPRLINFLSRSLVVVACLLGRLHAATFSGNGHVAVGDSGGNLSWQPANPNKALTVACWFKLSVPSDKSVSQDMVIIANRRDADPNASSSYQLRYSVASGNIEFIVRGDGAPDIRTVIARPYLERWYHVAVSRKGTLLTFYVDGRPVTPPEAPSVLLNDSTANNEGLVVGGSSTGKNLFGEVQEVVIYQNDASLNLIRFWMFNDLPAAQLPDLKGYFKLAFATNAADHLKNFAVPPPSGTSVLQEFPMGVVAFEEADKAGEQSLFDSRKNGGRDAVSTLSGGFAWQQTVFARPVPGIAFDFRFGYQSGLAASGSKLGDNDPYEGSAVSPGWRHTFETRVVPQPTGQERHLVLWDGAIETWSRTNSRTAFRPRHLEYRGELTNVFDADGFEWLEWTTPERLVYRFYNPTFIDGDSTILAGKLDHIRDFNGNRVQLKWNGAIGVLTQAVDSVQGTYNFAYQGNALKQVSFNSWQVNFAYDPLNRLSAKWITNTGPASVSGISTNINTRWEFRYAANGLLNEIVDPRGITGLTVGYDQYGRQTNQVDALRRANRTEYGVPGKRQIRRTDAAGFQWLESYDRKGRILAQQDPLTNSTSYTYDDRGNRTSATEPLGWRTTFGYDNRANVVAQTNELGQVATWKFHPFFNKAVEAVTPQPTNVNGFATWTNRFDISDSTGNLLRHHDALGVQVGYRYETNGLLLASTNANGFVTRFGYNTNGFLASRTEPFSTNSTVTTTYAVNDVGWKLRETNPLGDTTTYGLDLNGNPVRIQDVLGRVYFRTYDAAGNLLSTTDGKGQLTTYSYDAANQRTNTTDRTRTNTWSTSYTSRGKPERVTNPLGESVTNTFDAANRLIRVTDPLGGSITNQYDANGNLVFLFDKMGRRWSKTYDRLNRVVADANPFGDASQTSYDMAGRILQTTTPNGHPTLHSYDGRGRLTLWKDAEGFEWLYNYDGVGNITNITDALKGRYVMAYGPRNERLSEKNQDKFEWRYEYDELLRLRQQRDPNGTTRMPFYDAAGRVLFVDFSTGRRDTFTPDDNDNPRTISRRFEGVTTSTRFIYDALDRPLEQTDAHDQVVRYGYDALGRMNALTYPGDRTLTHRYDALGRLTKQVDWAGREMTYAYDPADRLVRRTWPNGVVQTNAFDDAGRLTALTHSASTPQPASINVALTYAYDRNGNKTGSGEKGTLRWPQPALTEEASTFTESGRLKTRIITDTSAPGSPPLNWSYAYDPSGNMTNAALAVGAAPTSQSWRISYDEDNRTTSLAWTTNGVTHTVLNRYDALGRRVTRTLDGVDTGYVLSLTGGMERILCDLDSGGAVTAWYVHGPDLCYRVDAADNVLCYHADAQANIIALTGANGTNLVQYAYTPYGRVLGSTSLSQLSTLASQPYLFVGSQGVMEEFPGLYFMRARYYSAEAGVFLSTDPVKKIGPAWKSVAYGYANGNPFNYIDPNGEISINLAAYPAGFIYGYLKRTTFDVTAGLAVAVNVVILGIPQDVAVRETERVFEFLDNATDGIFKESFVGRSIFSDTAAERGESARAFP